MAVRLSHILTKWRSKNGSSDLLLFTLAMDMVKQRSKSQMRDVTFFALRLLDKEKTNSQHICVPFQNNARTLLKLPNVALQSSKSHLAETFLIQSRYMQQIVNQGSDKDTSLGFKNSDICIITDDANVQIARSTFEEAKNLASTRKSRLVFIRKNADGSLLFRLQANASTNTESNPKEDPAREEKVKKKQDKSTAKEFTIKASIKEHDFDIKIKRMRSLIVKNKTLVIFIKTASDKAVYTMRENFLWPNFDSADKNAGHFSKKLTESLGDVCKVHQDFSNETTTRYTLTPVTQENASSES